MICNCTSQDVKAITQWSGQLFLYFVLNLVCGNNTKRPSLSYNCDWTKSVVFLYPLCLYSLLHKYVYLTFLFRIIHNNYCQRRVSSKVLEILWHLKNHHLIFRESSLFNFLLIMLMLDMQYMEWQVLVLRVHNLICWCSF